jgi:hypothetical protein
MSRNLPPPATVNDFYVAAAVEVLDEVARLLGEILNRLPESASRVDAGGPGPATPEEAPAVEKPADEVADPKPKAGAVPVTEPAPAKAAKSVAKKATPKPVKES